MMNSTYPKICIAAICKNEERFIKFFIDELLKLGFNDFVFVDTGSTDKTIEIIQSYKLEGIKVFSEVFLQPSFDKFRNAMWSKVVEYSNADYALVLDIDELLVNSTYEKLSKFLIENNSKAFNINRADICDGDVTKLKRLLKIEDGKWYNMVHEHFAFSNGDEVKESNIDVIHLSTERIKSKHKFENYKKLIDLEFHENGKIEYLYFKIIDAFSSCNTAEMFKLLHVFKKSDLQHNNFFVELILFTFMKFSLLLNDQKLKEELDMLAIKHNKFESVQQKFNKFASRINTPNSTELNKTYDFIQLLGRPTTVILSFQNVSNILPFITFLSALKNTFGDLITHTKTNIHENELVISISINNDLAFYQKYFGGFLRKERICLTKFCLLNNITRKTYYEQ